MAQRPQLACVPQAEVLLAADGQQGAVRAYCYVLNGALCRQAVKAFNRAAVGTRQGTVEREWALSLLLPKQVGGACTCTR